MKFPSQQAKKGWQKSVNRGRYCTVPNSCGWLKWLKRKKSLAEIVFCCVCARALPLRALWIVLQDASRLYVSNMNHFGRAGGYAALLSRIDPSRAAGPASMEEFMTYAGLLAAVPKCFVAFSKDHV